MFLQTLPRIGRSTEPQVSAPQCTKPDAKSAVKIPHIAAITIALTFSHRKCNIINRRFTAINVIQIPTQIHS